jgi:hypothetical protein
MTPFKSKWLDLASMGLSALCVAHCLLLPFLVAALPMFGAFAQNDWVHGALVLMAVPTSILAVQQSKSWLKTEVTLPMGGGLFLLAIAAFVPALHDHETALSIFGALLVAAAHAINYSAPRFAHRHTADCATDA